MNSLTSEYRNKYRDVPDSALTKKTTAMGMQYVEINPQRVEGYRRTELQSRTSALGQQLSNDRAAAGRARKASIGQTGMQIVREQIDSDVSRRPMRPVDSLKYQLTQWRKFAGQDLDSQTKLAVNTEIKRLENQTAQAELERQNQRADQSVADTTASAQNLVAGRMMGYIQTIQQGLGTLEDTEARSSEVTYKKAVDSAELNFTQSMNGAATQFRSRYLDVPTSAYVTRATSTGLPYQTLKPGAVSSERYAEWQQLTSSYGSTLTPGWPRPRWTGPHAEGQTGFQLMQRAVARYLAGHPMRPVDALNYQIDQWKKFAGQPLDPQVKLQVSNELDRLGTQLIQARLEYRTQQVEQQPLTTQASNANLLAGRSVGYLETLRNGTGDLADDGERSRSTEYGRSMDASEQQFASNMSSAAASFRDRYQLNPEKAFSTRTTARGFKYQVLNPGSVSRERYQEWAQITNSYVSTKNAAESQANMTRNRAKNQTEYQLLQRGMASYLAEHPMLITDQLNYQIGQLEQFVQGSTDRADQGQRQRRDHPPANPAQLGQD